MFEVNNFLVIDGLTFLPAIVVVLYLINAFEQNIHVGFDYTKASGILTDINFVVKLHLCWSIGNASANSVEFREIRPRMYIDDLLTETHCQ